MYFLQEECTFRHGNIAVEKELVDALVIGLQDGPFFYQAQFLSDLDNPVFVPDEDQDYPFPHFVIPSRRIFTVPDVKPIRRNIYSVEPEFAVWDDERLEKLDLYLPAANGGEDHLGILFGDGQRFGRIVMEAL